jgi:hypothetical protein
MKEVQLVMIFLSFLFSILYLSLWPDFSGGAGIAYYEKHEIKKKERERNFLKMAYLQAKVLSRQHF